jgi:hypothetical protein
MSGTTLLGCFTVFARKCFMLALGGIRSTGSWGRSADELLNRSLIKPMLLKTPGNIRMLGGS